MAYTDIDKPSDYFNTVTWTGTSDATTSVTGVNFQPDFVWIKNRNVADDHTLHDAVRGSTKTLFSNSTGAEGTNAESIQSFDSDGFTTGTHRGTGGNASNGMVSWNWLGSNGTASNTDGSITSTVSANTTSGFSIVSYTGNGTSNDTATIGHGLGVGANFIIIKDRSDTSGWLVSSTALGWNNRLRLEGTQASASDTYAFGVSGVTPSSSTFTVSASSGDDHTNISGDNYIAYCFAEKKGFSKFGSYTGNGSADGTFVYTGFKPAFVIIKRTDTTAFWRLYDNKRNTFNIVDKRIAPNDSGAETTADDLDFLSNGFKQRGTSGANNASGGSYIYMAFAENPFVTSTSIPCTAR
jgi:hypothetical protein